MAVAVVDGMCFDQKQSGLIIGSRITLVAGMLDHVQDPLSLAYIFHSLFLSISAARDFPISKRKMIGSPSDAQLPPGKPAKYGYPAYYCLLFTIVRATDCPTGAEVDNSPSQSTRWLYAKIAHGQYSCKTRMVGADKPDWTQPTDESNVAASDLICPLSNDVYEQQHVKLDLHTYWRDGRGFHDQKIGTTRVLFSDGFALNQVVKKEVSLDEGGRVIVQYAVFDRKVLGELLFPKIKGEQHRQEILKFTKWKSMQAARVNEFGIADGATAASLNAGITDTQTSTALKVVWCDFM